MINDETRAAALVDAAKRGDDLIEAAANDPDTGKLNDAMALLYAATLARTLILNHASTTPEDRIAAIEMLMSIEAEARDRAEKYLRHVGGWAPSGMG